MELAEHYKSKTYEPTVGIFSVAKSIIAEVLLKAGPLKSAIDVGCGIGVWLYSSKEMGISDIFGIDAEWIPRKKLLIKEEEFLAMNLEEPLKLNRTFDLVICLETAEHLPEERADSFVSDLIELGDLILFGAAIPFQGGRHHINEQFPQYWIDKFRAEGYYAVDIRNNIKKYCINYWWYAQNTFLFFKKNSKKYCSLPDELSKGLNFVQIRRSILQRIMEKIREKDKEKNG